MPVTIVQRHLLRLYVGYRKEQIKVQIDRYGKLKINGERPLEGNRWSRFRKEFQVPENCNTSEIRAKFENGRLNVLLPITEVKGQEQPTEAPQEPKESQKPATEAPKPSAGQDDMNQKATVKPNGAAKKQEDEKKGTEPVDARKDAQKEKEGEKEKDQTEEKKYHEEKVTGAVRHEEGEKGDAVPDDGKKKEEVSEPAANGANGRNGERKLKHKLDELGLDFDKQKQIMVNGILAAVLLVGLGWYLITHKLSPMEEGGPTN